MPIDSHLLNKIRAVIALRDKGATDGERDAAQQRLTVLLAKHKLTEQDIPSDNFSTRGRSYRPPPHRARQRPHASDFDVAFEETLRKFREAHFRADPRAERQQRQANERARRERERTGPHTHPPEKRPVGRIRFEGVFGKLIVDEAWRVVKLAQTEAARKDMPSNKAAYARAFYEEAAIELRTRVYGLHHRRAKSTNAAGSKAGKNFGLIVDALVFTYPNES